MSDEYPTIGDIMREEHRICMDFERANPGMTLDGNGMPVPKRKPSTAQRCDTCTKSRATCGHAATGRMICCPDYSGTESFAAFRAREESSHD